MVALHNDSKKFDYLNRLSIRKGYEKTNFGYYIKIDNTNDLKYVINLCQKLYNSLLVTKQNISDYLLEKIKQKIINTDSNFITKTIGKGLVFKNGRNFAAVAKTKYGLYIRLLNVEDNNKILEKVGKRYDGPLCKCFKVYKESDIDIIFPYIIRSSELSKIIPLDIKYNLMNLYYCP